MKDYSNIEIVVRDIVTGKEAKLTLKEDYESFAVSTIFHNFNNSEEDLLLRAVTDSLTEEEGLFSLDGN